MTQILATLRKQPATKAELVRAVGATSPQTIQKALHRLRDEYDAPLTFDTRAKAWGLNDPRFALPLDAPEPQDLVAVLVAEAIVGPLADDELRQRLRRLAEQMDGRLRALSSERGPMLRTPMTASLTLGTRVDPVVLQVLLGATRRSIVSLSYYSPWKHSLETVTVEPWELRIHDGSAYLRAWCREANAARTYRLVHVERVETVRGEPTAKVPVTARMWGDEAPAYGIDSDRPGTAVVVMRGAVARWVHGTVWHPDQQDRWLDERRERLERRLPYRSCRELARRLLSVIDALESVEPPELRGEVDSAVDAWRSSAEARASGRTKPAT